MTVLRRILLLALLLLPAAAGAEPRVRPWRFFGSYDYFFPVNSGQGLRDQLENESALLLAGPGGGQAYDSTSFGLSSSGGAGTRVGALRRLDARTELGPSVGFILGPTMNSDLHAFSAPVSLGGLGNGGQTVNRSTFYVRLLGESRISLLDRGRWRMALASGWGLGLGHVDQSCVSSGSLTCSSPSSGSRTWTGFAWEVGPILSWRLEKVELNMGARYAGFPPFKGNDKIAPIRWESFGIFLGASL